MASSLDAPRPGLLMTAMMAGIKSRPWPARNGDVFVGFVRQKRGRRKGRHSAISRLTEHH